jgi:hypothetical protein
MTWGTRAANERATEQPVPERQREHHAAPAGTGQRIVGGNVRARAEREETAQPTQHELNVKRLLTHGLAELAKRDAEIQREKDQNLARIAARQQQVADAKAADTLAARRAEFVMSEMLVADLYAREGATGEEIQEVNQQLLTAGQYGNVERHWVALMELRARRNT